MKVPPPPFLIVMWRSSRLSGGGQAIVGYFRCLRCGRSSPDAGFSVSTMVIQCGWVSGGGGFQSSAGGRPCGLVFPRLLVLCRFFLRRWTFFLSCPSGGGVSAFGAACSFPCLTSPTVWMFGLPLLISEFLGFWLCFFADCLLLDFLCFLRFLLVLVLSLRWCEHLF